MKILNVNSLIDLELGGGTAMRTLQISKALSLAGHEVGIISLSIGSIKFNSSFPNFINFYILKVINKRFQLPIVSFTWLRSVVANYDIVHLMGHWSILNAIVAFAARLEGVPYVICPAGALPIFGRSQTLKKIYNNFIGKKLISYASGWVAITEDERAHFKEYGVNTSEVIVIPNGIDPEDYVIKNYINKNFLDLTLGNPYILFMGRINQIKGPDLLLNAFEKISKEWPCLHLIFAGPDNGMQKFLSEQASNLLINNKVHFIGFISGFDKIQLYRQAKMLVIPSRSEAMSIVVLEAGACALPVVLTDQCGFNAVQSCGAIVVSVSSDSISDGIKKLLLCDSSDLKIIGNNLQDFVFSNYTWSSIVDKYNQFYLSLIKKSEHLS
jgi:glycosyltransferase involved in cell wall biosynthesis